MKTIYFATSNAGKVANAQKALRPFGISIKQLNVDLIESRSENPSEIALEKAIQAFTRFKKPLIVEDSGFFIRALNDFPMTHIKYSLKTIGVDGVLKLMKGKKDRHAEWRMSLAYVWGPRKQKVFTFVEKGEISKNLRPIKRQMMSDYWRIYIPKQLKANKKALCEMEADDLLRWQEYYATHNQFCMFGEWFRTTKP